MGPLITSTSGVSIAIVKTLKTYNKKIPVGFLTKILGTEVQHHLDDLEGRGVVKRDGDDVFIV